MNGLKTLLAGAFFCAAAGGASAATTISASDNGWYDNTGFHQSPNTTVIAGECNTCDIDGTDVLYFNNFFMFDLGALAGQTVVSATLTLFGGNGWYGSDDPSETLGLFDYTGSIDSLLDGTAGVAAFNDLGSGNSYGQTQVFGANFELMPEVNITLSGDALAAINAALASSDQRFAIGGSLLSIVTGGAAETLYNASFFETAGQLSLNTSTVPVPGSLVLLGTAIAGLFAVRRRARQSVA